MAKIYEDNSFAIGNTPLVKLKSVTKNAKATVLAKIEGRNPAYSVKCRIGANMIWDAEKSGKLTKDKTIVEPTSGNTGIALAFKNCEKQKRPALITYIVAGDNTKNNSLKILEKISKTYGKDDLTVKALDSINLEIY